METEDKTLRILRTMGAIIPWALIWNYAWHLSAGEPTPGSLFVMCCLLAYQATCILLLVLARREDREDGSEDNGACGSNAGM